MSNTKFFSVGAFLLVFPTVLAGCAEQLPPTSTLAPILPLPTTAPAEVYVPTEASEPDASPLAAAVNTAAEGDGETEADSLMTQSRFFTLAVSPEIVRRCRLATSQLKFEVGGSGRQDRAKLRRLADCLNMPPLDDLQIQLTTRASVDDNAKFLSLVQRRVQRIKESLMDNGIPAGRIATSAAGDEPRVMSQSTYSFNQAQQADIVLHATNALSSSP